MINVQRDATDEAGEAIKPNDAWFQRAADATATAIAAEGAHEADSAIYAHAEVRTALERLFHDKCAYCESKMTATADWDVDHFRPKRRVAEREDHRGYYWLIYEWANLYPSCQHCNQRRKDRPRWADPTERPAGGKADQFPLLDESTRVMRPSNDVYAEHTLLIDPCFDDPEDYLGYDATGQILSLDYNPYGQKTIEVLRLYRGRLRDSRRDTLKAVLLVMKLLASSLTASNAGAAADLQAWLVVVQASESQHAGLARYIVKYPSEFGV